MRVFNQVGCLLFLWAWVLGCRVPDAEEAVPPEEVTEDRQDAPKTDPVEAVTRVALRPVMAAPGPVGVVPSKFVIEFTQDLAERHRVKAPEKTVLRFSPPVDGSLSFTQASKLEFVPKAAFAPGTGYEVTLKSVQSKDGVVHEGEEAWKHRFETPSFSFVRVDLHRFHAAKARLELDLVYSAPVEWQALRREARWRIKERPVEKVSYQSLRSKNRVRVVLRDRRLTEGVRVSVSISKGVPYLFDAQVTADAIESSVDVPKGKALSIMTAYVKEGAGGHFITVVCRDLGHGDDTMYFWESGQGSYRVSPRCVLDEDDARRHVHIHPKVDFSISPTRGGFRILGKFERKNYTLRIEPGARSVDGGIVKRGFEKVFSIPLRSPQLSFVAQGRYVARKAFKGLAIRHMNVSTAKLSVRHIRPENLVFWLGENQENATLRNSDLVLTRKLPLRREDDQLITTWMDGDTLVPAQSRGVLEFKLTGSGAEATSRLLMTDLNLVAKRQSGNNQVSVWVLDAHDHQGVGGVKVVQKVKSGRTLSECTTDLEGACVLDGVPKDALDKSPPFLLVATKGNDLSYLRYEDFPLETPADVHGRSYREKSPYRAALYSDRGVYRPGDVAHVAVAVREQGGQGAPADMPVILRLLDPKKKVVRKVTTRTNAAGMVSADFKFAPFATTGMYHVYALAGGRRMGEYRLSVEEFVPERMKVEAKAGQEDLLLHEPGEAVVKARYLFGGSAEGSRVELGCELVPSVFKPKKNRKYQYGPWKINKAPFALGSSSGQLGPKESRIRCPAFAGKRAFGPAKLMMNASVFEAGSGRTTRGQAALWMHPETFYLGLYTESSELRAQDTLVVEGLTVDWHGKPVAVIDSVELLLYRVEEEHDWVYDEAEGTWSHRRYQRLALEAKTTSSVQENRFKANFTIASRASGFVVRARAQKAQSELFVKGVGQFYWWDEDGAGEDRTPRPQKPAPLALNGDERLRVSGKHGFSFVSPFKGRALLTLETDELLKAQWLDVEEGKVKWDTQLESFQPNVYFSALVLGDPYQDSPKSFVPRRAFGVRSLVVEPVEFVQDVKMTVPEVIRSNSQLEVSLDLGPLEEPTYVTVAVVDEGILSLTKFQTPDPLREIFDQRALGVRTHETVGWNLMLPAEGPSSSTGGDAASGDGAGRVQPIKPVALWSGLLPVPREGRISLPFEVPEYRGRLRVMAITVAKNKMGRAQKSVVVRDPVVVQATFPRFMSFEDHAEIPVFLTNVSGKKQNLTISIGAERIAVFGPTSTGDSKDLPVKVEGAEKKMLSLGDGESGTVVFSVRALEAIGAVRLEVRAEAKGLAFSQKVELPLIPAAPKTRRVQRVSLLEGRTKLAPYLKGWVPTTERSTFWVTSNPYGRSFSHLKHLVRYPYGCIEQTTSSARPLLFLSRILRQVDPEFLAKQDVNDKIAAGIDRVLSMQTPEGGFAYWPGGGSTRPWSTAYATHFLLDAKRLRHVVDQTRIDDALEWMGAQVQKKDSQVDRRSRAYMHYVLALAGRGQKAAMLHEVKKSSTHRTGQDKEDRYLLMAGLYAAGDHRYERSLRHPDISPVSNERKNNWSFYSDRRRRGLMLSVFADLFGSDKDGESLATLVAGALEGHSSAWYSTQELVWGITGLGKFLKEASPLPEPPKMVANGRVLKPEGRRVDDKSTDASWTLYRASEQTSLELSVKKEGKDPLYLVISSEGVLKNAPARIGNEGLKLTRRYRSADGGVLDLELLELGDLFYAELSLTNTKDALIQNIALVDRFPSGWEVENPRLGRKSAVNWLDRDEIWSAEHMNLRDDRVEVFGTLRRGETKKIVYALRAVTAGNFALPPAEAEAMYDPSIWSRVRGGRVRIEGPWQAQVD